MSDIKWIKLSVDMFDDEKIKLIRSMPEGNSIIVIWIQLLSLAGKTNDIGMIYISRHMAYSEEMLATIFEHPVNVIRLALSTLQSFGLIEVNPEGVINISNWEKHQSTDKMERVKEQNKIRQNKHYYRVRLRNLGVDVDSNAFTDDLDEMKDMYHRLKEEPNVSLTLANDTEVRSKKEEVRGKKEEVRSEKEEVRGKKEEVRSEKEEVRSEKEEVSKQEFSEQTKKKSPYGDFTNVLLTDDEYSKLVRDYTDYEERIQKLSYYIESTGKKYKSHYATVKSWARNEKKKTKQDGRLNNLLE